MAGCGSGGGFFKTGSPGYAGAVVADEPHAALIGREVLTAGGSAGDAAVATYFALAVTLPSTAGLGGGGVCVGFDPTKKRMEALEFMPRPSAGGAMAIPANVRGMALLHSRFGKLPWNQLLGAAEQLARIGTEVSRAFASDLDQPDVAEHADRALRQLYAAADGGPVREGAILRQPDLAAVIARVRTIGGGDFYSGQVARQLVEGARDSGGDLTLDDLRRFVPQRVTAITLPIGNHVLVMPPLPAAGGAVAADLYTMVTTTNYRRAPQGERVHIMAAAIRRAMAAEARRVAGQPVEVGNANRARTLMADYRTDGAGPPIAIDLPPDAAPPAASFVAMDSNSMAVACTVSAGGWFGSGRLFSGTGIAMAPPPPRGGALSMVPLVVGNTNTDRSIMALGSVDGRYAAAAAVETLLGTLVEGRRLEDILARPRLADDGESVLLEPEADDTAMALEQVGYKLTEVPRIGRVNAIVCPPDVSYNSSICESRADPRGFGLSATVR
jgi:gamma-glutamyltranspeptidase/glutathione hydrolase